MFTFTFHGACMLHIRLQFGLRCHKFGLRCHRLALAATKLALVATYFGLVATILGLVATIFGLLTVGVSSCGFLGPRVLYIRGEAY